MPHEDPSHAVLDPRSPAAWIWHGIIAPGCVTLLTGESRVGKSRFVRALAGHRRRGQPFLDLPVRRGTTIVATEEHARFWDWQLQSARIDGAAMFHIEPFHGLPSEDQFAALQKLVLGVRESHGVDLLVLDPLSRFLPASEGAAAAGALVVPIADRFAPITAAGLAVLLIDLPGPMTPALFADVHVELRRLSLTNPSSGRRRLMCHRGYAETPRSLRFAMDYHWNAGRVLPEPTARTGAPHWPKLRQLLEQSSEKLTRNALHARWPETAGRPSKITLWRWLESAWLQGQLDRDGLGTTADPFRYGLPQQSKKPVPLPTA